MSTENTLNLHGNAVPLAASSATGLATARRITWGAVAAGVVIAVAMQLVLSLLGAGVGLSSIDMLSRSTPDGGSFGIGAAAWLAVSGALSLFVAGAVASRLSSSVRTSEAVLHGLVTWAVAALVGTYVLTSMASALVRGASSVAGAAAGVSAAGIAAAAGPAIDAAKRGLAEQGVTFSFEGLQAEAKKLLAQTGKPDLQPGAVTAKANQAATEAGQAAKAVAADPTKADTEFDGVVQRILKAGSATVAQVDREAAVNVVMARAGVDRAEAEKRVDGWITTYQQARAKFEEQRAMAEQKAREAADATARATSQAAFGAAITLLIGALAAGFGGLFGRSRTVVAVNRFGQPVAAI